jgi:carbamoyltransferase
MKILGIHRGHESGVCLLENGEIIYHLEHDRLIGEKLNTNEFPLKSILKAFEIANYEIDVIAVSSFCDIYPAEYINRIDALHAFNFFREGSFSTIYDFLNNKKENNIYTILAKNFLKNPCEIISYHLDHHKLHSSLAFYNSGFEEATCVTTDGQGSTLDETINDENDLRFETESIFYAKYPAIIHSTFKKYNKQYNEKGTRIEILSVASMYNAVSYCLGFKTNEAGKLMGLAAYGKKTNDKPDDFFLLPNFDKKIYDYFEQRYDVKWKKNHFGVNLHHEGSDFDLNNNFQEAADWAYWIQEYTQNHVLKLLQKGLEQTGSKNITMSGGYGYNITANYFYRKLLPPDVNLYCEPVAGDAGLSISAAKKAWYDLTGDNTIRPISHLYFGPKPNYNNINEKLLKNEKLIDVSYSDVVELLTNKNIVSIFQGCSELGPRALGNRSILFDPREKDGKQIVNTIKRREMFRPFAGSVLEEYSSDWFDMAGLKNSPFMMYGVDVLKNRQEQIPAITHVDGTCRIQTVNQIQNPHYYNLIKTFYEKTGVPILFDTSFNLAGQPIVETIEHALWTMRNCEMKYMYLPDLGKLYIKG